MFENLKKIHILGIGGTLMGSFACFLKRQGFYVTGSDQKLYPPMSLQLAQNNITIYEGFNAANLTQDHIPPDLVIVGNVISANNIEMQAVQKDYPYTSLPEALEKFILFKTRNHIIAGTHGKTTTATLAALAFSDAKRNPNFFLGGVPQDLPFSFQIADESPSHPFILEGDEYDTAFWDKVPKFFHYKPTTTILTSVEFDHADIYPSIKEIYKVFQHLCQQTSQYVIAWDKIQDLDLITDHAPKRFLYGTDPKSDFIITNIQFAEKTTFEVHSTHHKPTPLSLNLAGMHNVLNATAVWAQCFLENLDASSVQASIARFKGVKRRQEFHLQIHDTLLIEDFAHHPTAVKETLLGLKARFPHHRLICLFEPRSATSKRAVFQDAFVQAFSPADAIGIAAPFDQSKLPQTERLDGKRLSQEIQQQMPQKSVFYFEENKVAQDWLKDANIPKTGKNLILLCSNGAFGGLLEALKKQFQEVL
jgi:UDP-N-acetylmuramate: L-alanyl-gamma-D-glutamyl-meso-diaminopimelate ligase